MSTNTRLKSVLFNRASIIEKVSKQEFQVHWVKSLIPIEDVVHKEARHLRFEFTSKQVHETAVSLMETKPSLLLHRAVLEVKDADEHYI